MGGEGGIENRGIDIWFGSDNANEGQL